MLTITQIGGAKQSKAGARQMDGAAYYAKYLADQQEAGEPIGKWFGAGVDDFGLAGTTPDLATLSHFFKGEDTNGNKLVKGNAAKRKSAYDLTFNCGKDVSILFALADDKERQQIQQAQQRAVEKALQHIQNNATYTREGSGGSEVVQVKRLIVATFEHSTARMAAGESRPSPHLHTHCVIPNIVKCDNGKCRTLHPDFYRHQMIASAIHSAELSSALQAMGYAIEPEKNGFKIAGVPEPLKQDWSGRRQEILATEAELKLDGNVNIHKRRELAAIGSRREKGEIDRSELFSIWQQEAAAIGIGLDDIKSSQAEVTQEPWSVDEILQQMTVQQSTFSKIQLHKHIALASIVDGDADLIQQRLEQALQSPEIVRLGQHGQGDAIMTTREVLELERSIQHYAISRKHEERHTVGSQHINQAIANKNLSSEQQVMLRHCCADDGVVTVQGAAGAGKSYSLGAVREAYQNAGYNIIGCALAAVAAQNLEEGSGIKSGTIHRLLIDVENGRQKLDGNSVVVIDEAGTADARLIHQLIQAANGAKLIFVGDTMQLEAIGLSFFRNMQQSIGFVELAENRRQTDTEDRKAVKQFRDGNVAEAIQNYANRGLLKMADNGEESQSQLIEDWNRDRLKYDDMGIILASTNRDCRELNQMAREQLQASGQLQDGKTFASEYGSIKIAIGDRVVFGRNDVRLGLKNGSQATVVSIDGNSRYTVRMDSGATVTIDTKEYGYVRHGYAVTTHKAQGQTVSRAYVYSSGVMLSKELGYVQLTRAKGATHIYADKETIGDLSLLSIKMGKSQEKMTSIDMDINS